MNVFIFNPTLIKHTWQPYTDDEWWMMSTARNNRFSRVTFAYTNTEALEYVVNNTVPQNNERATRDFFLSFLFFHSSHALLWLSLQCELWLLRQLRYVRAQVACFRCCANWSSSTFFCTFILPSIVFFQSELMFLLLNRRTCKHLHTVQ